MSAGCPFCRESRPANWQSDLAIAFQDAYPVTPGHTLVIPRRHVPTYFDCTPEEQAALWQGVAAVKAHLDATLSPAPDGYNVGFNVHEAAGQTVAHAHIHIIPRRHGDVPNPRGGVRWVIPSKADYKLDWDSDQPQDVADITSGKERPLAPWLLADLSRAARIEIAVAFVWQAGLEIIFPRIEECLENGGAVRFLTGDYEYLTAPDALRRLLDLADYPGMELRIYETLRAQGSFHPKAYLLSSGNEDEQGVAYVGSSNLSKQALETGLEWNARLDGVAGVRRARKTFDRLFTSDPTTPVTHEWVRAYEERREKHKKKRGESDVFIFDEPAPEPFTPHPIQQEALEALADTREAGNEAGLVVLATGLGKTWLAAFDSQPFARVLFVAHREEILRQAMHTFRAIRPKDRFGLYTGSDKHMGANVLFASIQTLAREAHRKLFDPGYFDYIVVDEFHHAAARTYRELIRYFRPRFLLGLTATPDRSDGGDLLALCDDNLVYECHLGRGITDGRLAPFHYHGIPDLVDYENIPWRSRKFDEAKLSEAVETQERAQNALEQWRKHAGPQARTIGFCVSQRHADFMREFFLAAGVRAASVHSNKATSDSREASLKQLHDGELDVLFAVDMFNEGLDIKNVDTVLMLRPTESRILWLQQIGRGLRKCEGKDRLQIIDYIGNHKVFLQKPAALLGALGIDVARPREIANILRNKEYEDALPPGCEVTYELEAIEVLEKLFPATRSVEAIVDWYREFEANNGVRPTALQAHRAGRNPRATAKHYGSWLGFVEEMGGLGDAGTQAWKRNAPFLEELQKTPMSRGYKMYVLEAMLWMDAMPGTATVPALAETFARVANRSTARREDVSVDLGDLEAVEALLRKNPIAAWTGRADKNDRAFFELDADAFRVGPGIRPGDSEAETAAFVDLVAEIVEWRVVEYLEARRAGARFKVIRNASGKPILKIDRKKAELPAKGSWAEVTIDGDHYRALFQKIAVNKVVRADDDSENNVLPELMYSMFGSDAGAPGTRFAVAQDVAASGGYQWSPADVYSSKQTEGVKIRNDEGTEIDARMLVEELDDGSVTIVVMSRGGGRNDSYADGVETLLGRLSSAGASITRIAVESGGTKTLDLEARTLQIPDNPYPINLAGLEDARGLRLEIGRAGAALGRKPGAKGGGNQNKRIRIWVTGVSQASAQRCVVP